MSSAAAGESCSCLAWMAAVTTGFWSFQQQTVVTGGFWTFPGLSVVGSCSCPGIAPLELFCSFPIKAAAGESCSFELRKGAVWSFCSCLQLGAVLEAAVEDFWPAEDRAGMPAPAVTVSGVSRPVSAPPAPST